MTRPPAQLGQHEIHKQRYRILANSQLYYKASNLTPYLQRLKTGGAVANAETYDYDLVGNRTTSFLSTSHNHNDLNRLLEDDQFFYTYDNNGNLETKTTKANPTEVTTYQWDAQDQLIQIDRPNSTTVTYKYDGLGRRIEKNVDSTITRYVYDGEDILLEYSDTNTFMARYSHGDQVDQPLVLQKAGVGFFYYHSNHQGSITHLTDSSGTIANSYVYDSYGRQLSVFESVIQPFSYTGREYDAESGLYFYRARYFDAMTGRFLAEDPIRFRAGDQNLYRYVFNDPVNFIDPFGLRGGTLSRPSAGGRPNPNASRLLNQGEALIEDMADLAREARNEQIRENLVNEKDLGGKEGFEQFDKDGNLLDAGENEFLQDPDSGRFQRKRKFKKPPTRPDEKPLCNTCPCP